MKLELIAATTFGLEAVVRREIEALGYKIIKTEDGRVIFEGSERAIVRANLWLRSADRVQIKMAEFKALEFEDIFQNVKGIPWEEWIPMEGNFIVNAVSVKSKISSVPAIQKVGERALIDRLRELYPIDRFPKTGAEFDVRISIHKDMATVTLDTTGPGLNKRGYRRLIGKAPLKETMAAAMVNLSFWNPDRILVDPCCGSGTIPIEAAMIAKNIAPGLSRSFASEEWDAVPKNIWKEERARSYKEIRSDLDLKIYGSDIDPAAIKIAKENAEEAGVGDLIRFSVADVSALKTKALSGVMISNPPYGERIGDREAIDHIYDSWKKFFGENPTWSLFALTSDKTIEEKVFGKPADRRRKLYNGRMEVCYYQFHGKKP
ncbi:MAG: class I SAM-dependent RNA methyltransferase [Clostridiales bacterium]|jgi:putative N6-adenine-specific DNA methylase|nr:class I SAM-dependent RNA methyltransferase [Clostridiales bacterium]MBR6956112.1 class I SAM-dependent RNA methyltransferase [Bacillota bacterium]